ncbi:MAG: hypothetical protein ACRDOI_45990 [Trebonia sp.]
MSIELEDLERRVELLEGQLASVEYRLDISQMHLEVVTGWRQADREAGKPGKPPGAVDQEAGPDTPDANVGRVESMLRQVLSRQIDHAAGLRTLARSVRLLAERNAS